MSRKPQDQESQIRDIRKQLNEQFSCLELRSESKLSLLNEIRDFFKKRGEVEFQYAQNLERLCERFEKSTKQRNLKHEVRSTFNLWSTLLAETRRMARDRASLAEVLAAEMVARLDVMAKDVTFLSRKCKELFTEIQDSLFKEFKELNEQTKVYQYACHHSSEAYSKLAKCREKVDAVKNSAVRKKKAEEKEDERQRQYNEQKHRQLKSRNDYLLRVSSANAHCLQYYSDNLMDIVELMDYDYHDSFSRLSLAYHEAEQEACQQVMRVTGSIVDQTQALNFENDLHYFLSEFSSVFSQPPEFNYMPFGDDDVWEYKVNTKDVFLRAQEMVKNLTEETQTLKLQKEGDIRTIEHVNKNNLAKYRVQAIDDALAVLEEMGEPAPPESRSHSLDRGSLIPNTRGVQALYGSQKGKEDTLTFTVGVYHRKLARSSQLNVLQARLDILEKSLSEQKVPPVSIGGDYRVPKLFEGDCLEYIMATGSTIPLILQSCCQAIEEEGLTTEGLFRIPGPAQQIEDLKKAFEEGRDPLAYSSVKNIEITAVASVLKLYFRELTNPLFPCDKYYDFIKCIRKEEPQDRLDSLRDTVQSLHPAIVTVMRYLFKFIKRVSSYASNTKMNTANLALVFGPTLTRAPPGADARTLHNDVPSINVLIQLCIEQNEYIFGLDAEEEGLISPPPPPELDIHITEQPPEPHPLASPKMINQFEGDVKEVDINKNENEDVTPESVVKPEVENVEEEEILDEVIEEPISENIEPVLQSTTQEYVSHDEEAIHIPVPEKPQSDADVVTDVVTDQETVPPPKEDIPPDVVPGNELTVEPPPQVITSPTSMNKDMNYLQQVLMEIDQSIDSMKSEQVEIPEEEEESKRGKEDEEDEDSDTDSEEVMTITAKAIYDYTARNEKELTFEKGVSLEVIEKSNDGNWWDGIYQGKRGYIPVSYVEIAELLSVPKPPARKSSMQKPEENLDTSKDSNLGDVEEDEESNDIPKTLSFSETKVPEPENETGPEVKSIEKIETTPSKGLPDESPKRKVDVNIRPGAVSKLTQQFQSPPHVQPTQQQTQPRILVGPHSTAGSNHRRIPSADLTKTNRQSDGVHVPPRSSSGGNKLQMKSAVPPPPIKPRPDKEPGATPFPIMSHDANVSASPLQQAHLQQQVGQVKKPLIAAKKTSILRSSGKGKKPPLPSKPLAPPKPTPPQKSQLHAELAAVAARRRKPDDES